MKRTIMKCGFLVVGVIVALTSCNSSSKFNLRQLEGIWYYDADGTTMIESWESSGINQLKGVGKEVIDGIESDTEYLEIKMINDTLNYVASVIGQNNGNPVFFKAISVTKDKVIFSNPTHDFPQFISYAMTDHMNLLVTIGLLPVDDSPQSFDLKFSRSRPNIGHK